MAFTQAVAPSDTYRGLLRQIKRRIWLLVVVSELCFVMALLAVFPAYTSLIIATGSAILGVIIAVILHLNFSRRFQTFNQKALFAFAARENDTCFISDIYGTILRQNAASMKHLGRATGQPVSTALAGLIANPQAVVMRLKEGVMRDGSARETVRSTTHVYEVTAQGTSAGYIWRVAQHADTSETHMESVVVPMAELDPQGGITRSNTALRYLLGYTPTSLEQIIGASQARKMVSGGLLNLQALNRDATVQVHVVQSQNRLRQAYFFPVSGLSDQSSVHFDPIVNNLPVPLLHLSTSGRILHANRLALSILPEVEGLSVTLPDLLDGLGRPINEWLADAARGHGLGRTEVVRVTDALPEKYLQITLGRAMVNGAATLVAVFNDVTELKTLEAQVIQSQKMQAIGQLAGGVAHDFNNLLTAISGHCDLLMLRFDKRDDAYQDLAQINENANRAAALVGQLLAFSRKQKLEPEFIDLRSTLSDLTHLLDRLVGEQVRLTYHYDPGLPSIRADRRQLEQVLMNLVVNARDAMPKGGEVRVEAKCVQLQQNMKRGRASVPAGAYVVVHVIDEGCGIPADQVERIFEPFVTTKKKGEGTGLGLSMAYGIVKQTGGYIFVESEIGRGSDFSLYFPAHEYVLPDEQMTSFPVIPKGALSKQLPKPFDPCQKAIAICSTVAKVEESDPRKPTKVEEKQMAAEEQSVEEDARSVVLLVEDEAPVRAFAARALRLRGYPVVEAASGEEALEQLEDTALDVGLFVTDVMMPGLDGPSWVKQALEKRPSVRTIFVSGYAESSLADAKEEIPNSVFLPKPFSLSDLTQTVQQQLS